MGKDRVRWHGMNMFNIKYIYVQNLENRKFLIMSYKRKYSCKDKAQRSECPTASAVLAG